MLKSLIEKIIQCFKKRKETKSNDTAVDLPKCTLTHSEDDTDISIPVETTIDEPDDVSIEEKIKKDKSLMISASEANRLVIEKILNKDINKETLEIITNINQYILLGKSFQWIIYVSNNSSIDYTYICQYYECLGYKIIKQTRTITIEWGA